MFLRNSKQKKINSAMKYEGKNWLIMLKLTGNFSLVDLKKGKLLL